VESKGLCTECALHPLHDILLYHLATLFAVRSIHSLNTFSSITLSRLDRPALATRDHLLCNLQAVALLLIHIADDVSARAQLVIC
jgi:hypothetical protein